MATVLLLRHGRTAANASGGLAGRSPIGLDEEGVAQAVAVGRRLREVSLAAVVTSPLERCRQTVATALPDLPAVVDERLTECGYGDWEGRSLKELASEPLWPVVQHHPSAARFPGPQGESMAAMAARAVAAVREWDARVAAEHGPEAVWLACSHGDVIKARAQRRRSLAFCGARRCFRRDGRPGRTRVRRRRSRWLRPRAIRCPQRGGLGPP